MATQINCDQLTGVKEEYQDGFHHTKRPFFEAKRGLDHSVMTRARIAKTSRTECERSRGTGTEEVAAIIVDGFIEPPVKELPMEYAVEMNRLIQLQMEGSIG